MSTHRKNLIELLTQGTFTLQELSAETHLSMREVLSHLEHVRKSIRQPQQFKIEPAECLSCGYIFKGRKKLHSPGKCPKCRSTHIKDPAYRI